MFNGSAPLFIETLSIRGGVVNNLEFHQERMYATGVAHHFSPPSWEEIKERLDTDVVLSDPASLYKCTITYRETIKQISLSKYSTRKIERLIPVYVKDLSWYNFKYANRESFENLKEGLQPNDEIIIVTPDGFISDTSYTNIVIEKSGIYKTPSTPLLKGTQRASLLKKGVIQEAKITLEDLYIPCTIHLINALMPLGTLSLRNTSITQ